MAPGLGVRGSPRLQPGAGADLGGDADRFGHRTRIGDALAGDVEGRAVVDRGAHDGQPQRDADALFETVDLDRDVALVVVHRYHRVELAPHRAHVDAVRRVRAEGRDTAGAGVGHRWLELLDLFAAHQPALAVVRVDAGDGDARPGHAPAPEVFVGGDDALQHALARDAVQGVTQ